MIHVGLQLRSLPPPDPETLGPSMPRAPDRDPQPRSEPKSPLRARMWLFDCGTARRDALSQIVSTPIEFTTKLCSADRAYRAAISDLVTTAGLEA